MNYPDSVQFLYALDQGVEMFDQRILFDAGREAKCELSQVKDLPESPDYPVPPGGEPHMKAALVTRV